MATDQELQDALINADKAGDKEAATTLATELQRRRQVSSGPVQIGAEGLPQALEQVSQEFSGPSKFAIGAAGWINSAAMRLKQLLGRDLTPQDLQGLQEYATLKKSSGAAEAGDIAMNLLATIRPSIGLQSAGTDILSKVLPRSLASAASSAGTGGLVTALTQANATPSDIGKSAAFSAGGDLAMQAASKVIQPLVQSEAVKKLTQEGIVPTPGQAKGGLVNKIEQRLEDIPVVGWLISGSRSRAVSEMDTAALAKALPPGTAEQIKAGHAGVDRAEELIDAAYDAAYGQLNKKITLNSNFLRQIGDIPKTDGIDLPPSLSQRFDELMKDKVFARLAGDGASPDAVRSAQNSLGALARKYRASGDADQRALGMAFAEAKDKFRELVASQSSGAFKQTLDSLDSKYSALLAIQKAANYQGSKEGIFSAEALRRASTRASPEFRDFAQTANDVLGRTVPDSGTPSRLLQAGLDRWLGGLMGAAPAALLYSRPGARYMVGDYAWQPIIAQTLRELAPTAGQAVRAVGQ